MEDSQKPHKDHRKPVSGQKAAKKKKEKSKLAKGCSLSNRIPYFTKRRKNPSICNHCFNERVTCLLSNAND